jgi:hypothetical protein
MRKLNLLPILGMWLMTALFFASATAAQAQQPPDYLHALSDLRMARSWIGAANRPQYAHDLDHAVRAIDNAIEAIKRAVADDGRNANFMPPPQGPADPGAPLHTALNLLAEARSDTAKGRDYAQTVGLQTRALTEIDDAHHTVLHVIHQIEGK